MMLVMCGDGGVTVFATTTFDAGGGIGAAAAGNGVGESQRLFDLSHRMNQSGRRRRRNSRIPAMLVRVVVVVRVVGVVVVRMVVGGEVRSGGRGTTAE